jgi:hypothetical protein
MPDIIIDRPIPSQEASLALDKALRDALGDKCTGISGRIGGKDALKHTITVHLSDKATAEDDNTARQIVLAHDFSKRTPEQEAQAERKRLREAARAKAQDSKATKDEQIEYLMLEVAHLREQLGVG